MTRGKTQLFGLLGVVALVTTMPIVVVAHQVSPSDSIPAPAACDVTPRSLADILSIGSGGSESATAVIATPGATIDAGTFENVAIPVTDQELVDVLERTVMAASACRESGDALRFLSYFTDGYIAAQYANGSLTDESLLRFGEAGSSSDHRVVAIQSIGRTADGTISAIVLTTTSPVDGARTDETDLLVEEYVFVDAGGTWLIDRVRRLADVSVSVLIAPSTVETQVPASVEATSTPTVALSPTAPVELSAPGIAWSTTELTVPQGGVIRLINDGSGGPHNFAIEGYNDDAPVDMPPGSQTDWTVPSDLAPGTYTFYCAIPGHRALMEGTITILPADAAAAPPAEGPPPAGGETVELAAIGIAWSPDEITIARGGTIHLVNDGSGGPHNFVIEGYNDDAPVDMPAGSESDWVVPDDLAPGTYTFYCGVPGHRQAGMEGTITVAAD